MKSLGSTITGGDVVEYAKQRRGASRKIIVAAILAVSVIALIIIGVRSYLFPSITVEALVSNQPGLSEVKDVTAGYCANEITCEEAWETQYGTYMKFDSKAEATHWGTIFGAEGAQWEKFVLDAREHDLSSDDRVTAVQILLVYDGV